MKQNKKIALTGGIGSGKSLLSSYFKEKGYPVFSCDEISRELSGREDYLRGLRALFPDCVEEGRLNRGKLSALVFSDREALRKLNAYSHPLIMRALSEKMDEGEGLCFAEVPLLYEGNFQNLFDGVIAVVRPKEARIAAVMARDGLGREQVEARMKNQVDEEFLRRQDCILLVNEGEKEELYRRADEILKVLRGG